MKLLLHQIIMKENVCRKDKFFTDIYSYLVYFPLRKKSKDPTNFGMAGFDFSVTRLGTLV